jgi:signal transduction histidine kinase/ActR/RegA family two-component response regulator
MEPGKVETESGAAVPETIDRSRSFSFLLPVEPGSRGVLVTDANHRVLFTDSNIFRLLGLSPARLPGSEKEEAVWDVLKHCFKDPDAYESSSRRLRDRPEEVLEEVLETPGPERRVLHRYSSPLFGENRKCLGRVEIYSDITKRRELEAAVRRAYEELRATQEQLVQSEKLRAIGEIASGVAHDFNNTLGIILGNIQLLIRTVEDERVRARLQTAERAALDGAETVRRIQEFTKMSPQEPRQVLELRALASEVVEMTKPVWQEPAQAGGRSIDLTLDLADGALALGNGPEIREVVANVLLNAIQAMPEGGSIVISTGGFRTSSWIRIADTGTGMTEEVRKRVFDPFFTTRGVAGSGLGMSVAYGIVRRHGGSISIESEPGKGTVVTIFLPSAGEAAKEEPGQPAEELWSGPAVKILVVDDERMFADVFVEMLSECGHAVCVARSGAEAIEQFKESPFDLVFTDLGMPEMSGWELARAIKSIEPQTPVVLLTGWGTARQDAEADGAEVDMVLSKPVRLEKLSSIVAEALGSRGIS